MTTPLIVDKDSLHRFIFENTAVRGTTVQLQSTYKKALAHHKYPEIMRKALGELMAASALLASMLKLQRGALILQIQGKGPIKLLVVECTSDLEMRATAKWGDDMDENLSFSELVGDGHFVITLDPRDGGQTYQGIVPLVGDSVSEVLRHYMERSEQIATHIWLCCDDNTAGGMLLQKMPDLPENDADAWNRISYLAETVKNEELLHLPIKVLLHRLFNEEDVRLFDPQAIKFHCGCSVSSVGNMLKMLGKEELHSIIEEQGKIEVLCDFCSARYLFDKVDTEQLFTEEIVMPSAPNQH